MRKSASIILLLILLFNMVGYRAWFYYAEKRSDAAIEARLDNNLYQESDLIALTIPLNMPYQIEQANFERVDGEFNYQGKIYKYVKRKISNGNLILLCIPNTQKMVLKNAKTELGNLNADITNSGNHKNSRSGNQKNYSASEYEELQANFQFSKISGGSIIQFGSLTDELSDPLTALPGKPPQAAAFA